MAAHLGLRLWMGGALACAGGDAAAAYQCHGPFGNDVIVERALDEATDWRCVAIEPAPAAAPVDSPRSSAESLSPALLPALSPVLPSPSRLASLEPGNRRGRLVLAPPVRSAVPTVMAAARRAEFDALIENVARTYGQDADLLRAIVQVESRFDPDAVSAKGAIGLMQIMPATAARLGLAEPQRTLFQPESNLRVGALYLRQLFVQFAGVVELVIAAYNAGENAVVRCGNTIPPYAETQGYVRDVLAIYRQLASARG